MQNLEVREPGFCLELLGFGNLRITRVFRGRGQPGYHPYHLLLHSITLADQADFLFISLLVMPPRGYILGEPI